MSASAAAADDRLRAFLADSLALWEVAGTVEAGAAPVVACILAANGARIEIERVADAQAPFRWFVRVPPVQAADGGTYQRHPRPCTSIVGVLHAIRAALGVQLAGRARIVPSV